MSLLVVWQLPQTVLRPPRRTIAVFEFQAHGDQAIYDRGRTGKPKMQAVGACMRKLVMICYGVLKNRNPFDPAWASRMIR